MFNVECLTFKDLEIMKALRYLLMVIVVAMVSVAAQAQPTAQFKNSQNQAAFSTQPVKTTHYAAYTYTTATLMESGSRLPLAARNGFTVGADSPDDNSSSGGVGGRNPRRAIGDGDDDIPKPDDNESPEATPIGDGVWVMMVMAAGYLIYRVRTRRREAME